VDQHVRTEAADARGQDIPVACDLSAITGEPVEAHARRSAYLFLQAAQERQELPDGYALRFSPDELPAIAAFIESERKCCPFFTFTLEVLPGGGPLWLRITGPAGAKEAFEQGLAQLREGGV